MRTQPRPFREEHQVEASKASPEIYREQRSLRKGTEGEQGGGEVKEKGGEGEVDREPFPPAPEAGLGQPLL